MTTEQILIILTTVFCIFSVISLILGLYSVIEVKAMQRSTHSVHFTPIDSEIPLTEKETQDFNKKHKEEYEEFMGL